MQKLTPLYRPTLQKNYLKQTRWTTENSNPYENFTAAINKSSSRERLLYKIIHYVIALNASVYFSV